MLYAEKSLIEKIACCAVRALLYEVSVTPKPGLVDRRNSGSHKDMDFYSFLDSSLVLGGYFQRCLEYGCTTYLREPEDSFRGLRELGREAEKTMYAVTKGINTHKGAIFSLGILCAAVGRILMTVETESTVGNVRQILDECSLMTNGIVSNELETVRKQAEMRRNRNEKEGVVNSAFTHGEKLYIEYGITGVRGQAENGFPAVRDCGLPLLADLLKAGKSKDEAGAVVLLAMLGETVDTNLIYRSNPVVQKKISEEIRTLLKSWSLQISEGENGIISYKIDPDRIDMETIRDLDDRFIGENLSPGGSADLLAICWFLWFLTEL